MSEKPFSVILMYADSRREGWQLASVSLQYSTVKLDMCSLSKLSLLFVCRHWCTIQVYPSPFFSVIWCLRKACAGEAGTLLIASHTENLSLATSIKFNYSFIRPMKLSPTCLSVNSNQFWSFFFPSEVLSLPALYCAACSLVVPGQFIIISIVNLNAATWTKTILTQSLRNGKGLL